MCRRLYQILYEKGGLCSTFLMDKRKSMANRPIRGSWVALQAQCLGSVFPVNHGNNIRLIMPFGHGDICVLKLCLPVLDWVKHKALWTYKSALQEFYAFKELPDYFQNIDIQISTLCSGDSHNISQRNIPLTYGVISYRLSFYT